MSEEQDNPVLREILDKAVGLPPEQRPAFLDSACGNDAELREQVESLLAVLADADDFLAQPTIGQTVPGAASSIDPGLKQADERPGTVIDRYKLLQKIGEGGMGAVYMAEQEKPVIRKVALKIVKLGMDTRQVIARFEAERQALAMMDHPNIAKVLDAGATRTGRPYFVMELVRGVPITEYCDTNKLTTRQRLELFIPVCRAVQHAHQKGIIHRDIKPSNVMITMHDGVPVPKVIDFGIAKATQGRLTDKTLFTEYHHLVGTPEYMSPEQAEMSGLDVDTRTDVYGLGVLLYELLTGTTPFDSKSLRRAAYEEIHRIIREVEPPKPSTRISTLGQTLTQTAAHRQIDPRKLGELMRGDLDWIVMRCLEKDRTRRYETASALAMDVTRHLDNEPVAACPPSRVYLFRKMVRRNKLAFAAAIAVTCALVLGITVSTWQAILATRAKQTAVVERANADRNRLQAEANEKKARTEAVRSDAVNNALRKFLGGIEAQVAMGQDTQLLCQLVDEFVKEVLPTDLKDQPEVEADLRQVLGKVYMDLADFEKAEEMFRKALLLRKQTRGGESLEVAQAMRDEAGALDMLDEKDAAWKMSAAALAMTRRLVADDDLALAGALSAHAGILRRAQTTSSRAAAVRLFEQALVIQRKHLGNESLEAAGTLLNLGMTMTIMPGRRPDAVQCFQDALRIRERLLPANDPRIADAMSQLGMVHPDREKNDFGMLREAIAMHTRLYGPQSRRVLQIRGQLGGWLAGNDGRRRDGEAELRDVVGIYAKLPSWGRPNMIGPLTEVSRLVNFLIVDKRPEEARKVYIDLLNELQPKFGADDPNVIRLRWGLAECWRTSEKLPEAEAELRAVDATLRSKPDWEKSEYTADVLDTALRLAYVLDSQSKVPEAEAQYREAMAILKPLRDTQHIAVGRLLLIFGNTLLARGKLAEAEQVCLTSLAIKQRLLGEDDIALGVNLNNLGVVAGRQGNFPEAERLYQQSIAVERKSLGGEFPDEDNSITLRNLAHAMLKQDKFAEADKVYRQAMAESEELQGVQSAAWDASADGVARVLQQQGKWADAAEFKKETLELRRKKLPPDHLATLQSMNALARAYYESGQYKLGLQLAKTTVQHQRAKLSADNISLVFSLGTLADLYEAEGYLEEALAHHNQTLKLARERLRPGNIIAPLDAIYKFPYGYAGRLTEAQGLIEEALRRFQAAGVTDIESVAVPLNALGWCLLLQEKFPEAETPLRKAFDIREKQVWVDWRRFETQSLLGAAMAGQRDSEKMDEAERLLLSGYEGMKQREARISIPDRKRINEAAERLVQFYESTSNPAEAAAWRRKLGGATTHPG